MPVGSQKMHILKGGVYAILSAFFFTVMCIFVKLIGPDLPLSEIVFVRFFISLIVLLPYIFMAKEFSFKVQHPLQHVIRVFAGLLTLLCTFYAINYIPLVDALLLNNTAPLFVPICFWIVFKIEMPKKATLGISLGFVGVVMILQPNAEIFSWPALFALLAGIFLAIVMVSLRLLSKTNAPVQILFYYFAGSTLVSGAMAAVVWQTPQNLNLWLMLLGIGISGVLFQLFLTLSYAVAPVRLMSMLTFFSVIFGGIFDWIIWNIVPSVLTLLGGALVILGAAITLYFGSKEISSIKDKHTM